MSQWTKIYTDDQRAAIEYAYCDLRLRPATRIHRLAAAGDLRLDGEPLPAFTVTYAAVLHIGKAAERRKAGRINPRPASSYRRRLEALMDIDLSEEERRAKRKGWKLDWELSRKIIRVLRELQALDDHKAPLGQHQEEPGPTERAATLSAAILKATDQEPTTTQPAPEHHTEQETTTETMDHADAPHVGILPAAAILEKLGSAPGTRENSASGPIPAAVHAA